MTQILNFSLELVSQDSLFLRVGLVVSGFAGLTHFGLRTAFLPCIAPYPLRLACALTAMLCGAAMFAAINSSIIFVMFLASLATITYTAYDILAWHYGVDVSNCFKCRKKETILLESRPMQDSRGTV